MVTRALRVGEGRKFRAYEKRVAAVNRFEPEMELLDDSEIRETADELRERAREGEPLEDLLAEDIRRQVKKHREKRRKRHTTRRMMKRLRGETA